jgi:hypothetical protein
MIAVIALHAVKFVGNRQRRQHRDFLGIYGFRHIGDLVHLIVDELREPLDVFPLQFSLDGIRLPENLHFYRRAHGFSMREDNIEFARLACRASQVLGLPNCDAEEATRNSAGAELCAKMFFERGNDPATEIAGLRVGQSCFAALKRHAHEQRVFSRRNIFPAEKVSRFDG